MRVSVLADDLASAMRRVARVVATRRNTIPIISHALLNVYPHVMTITGTNMDITVRSEVTVRSRPETTWAATIDARRLSDFASNLPGEAVVEITREGMETRVEAHGTSVTLPCYATSDFPCMDDPKETVASFALSPKDVERLFGKTEHAISREEARYYLNGTFLHRHAADRDDERLVGVATDGHRLVETSIGLPDGAAAMPPVIVPRQVVRLLLETVSANPTPVQCTLIRRAMTTPKPKGDLFLISFAVGNTEITAKTIDREYPDYRRVIASVGDCRCTLRISREKLQIALERLSLILSDKSFPIRIEVGEVSVGLRLKGNLDGETIEAFHAFKPSDALVSGKVPPVGIQVRYLQQLVAALDEGADIEFLINDDGSEGSYQVHHPVCIRQVGDDDARFVIMPIRFD